MAPWFSASPDRAACRCAGIQQPPDATVDCLPFYKERSDVSAEHLADRLCDNLERQRAAGVPLHQGLPVRLRAVEPRIRQECAARFGAQSCERE